ncbi:MAG: SUMF1/EgtB/PvdO family nonheme iron enzyme [Acidobacteria bacterium]|nr:SUMF1/EgtB/PvdO family nonheme iron enzyme [Acidobacteriota bacterium]
MTPERWQQVKSLIEIVLEKDPTTRMDFLAKECGDDKELYNEVAPLILAESEMKSFLEIPPHSSTINNSNISTLKYNNDDDLLQKSFTAKERFLDKYEIVRLIGKGGMGLVYQAKHIELDKFVAIKVLNTRLIEGEEAIERFKREARTLAKLEHANIVKVFDYGVKGTICYLIMEYLQGESLRIRLKNNKQIPLKEVSQFVKQVCLALEFVHKEGVVHRDLKPDNIFFHKDGAKETVKLLDFGIAKLNAVSSSGESLTVTGSIFGTPQYMSPEQCEAKVLDGRSDIYSLGLILYEMISGTKPYDGDSPLSFMYAHVHTTPMDLAKLMPDIALPVSKAVMYALVKNRENRCKSAKEFLEIFSGKIDPVNFIENSQTPNFNSNLQKDSSITVKKQNPKLFPKSTIAATILVLVIASLWAGRDFLIKSQENSLIKSATPILETKKTPTLPVRLQDKFVFIEGGKTTIGSNKIPCPGIENCETSLDETPPHEVTLDPYFLGKYEVTNQEYYEFIKAENYLAPKDWIKGKYPEKTEDLPVVNISWEDANNYCAWLSRRDGVDYRLPTEEEWENAARGKESFFYPWGNTVDKSFSYAYASEKKAELPRSIKDAPNNTTDRSTYGIFAMAGNVREWTSSDVKAYPKSEYQVEEKEIGYKVVRGGSYYSDYTAARNTSRFWNPPTTALVDVGFRLAITIKNNIK